MQLLVLTAAHGRHEIFKTFVNSVPHPLVIVGSDDDNKHTSRGDYFITENKPLGKKWNYGLEICKSYSFDYLVITGSDDIFSPDLWKFYESLDVHYAGFTDLYLHDKGRIKYFQGYSRNRAGEPQGAGRALHRNVLDSLNWQLWDDDLNIGLDWSMTEKLNKLSMSTKIIRLIDNEFVALSLKSEQNLHSIKEYEGEWLDESQAKWVLEKSVASLLSTAS